MLKVNDRSIGLLGCSRMPTCNTVAAQAAPLIVYYNNRSIIIHFVQRDHENSKETTCRMLIADLLTESQKSAEYSSSQGSHHRHARDTSGLPWQPRTLAVQLFGEDCWYSGRRAPLVWLEPLAGVHRPNGICQY